MNRKLNINKFAINDSTNRIIFQKIIDPMIDLIQVLGFNCNKKHNKIGVIACLGFIETMNLIHCAKIFNKSIIFPNNAVLRCKHGTIQQIDPDKRKYIGKIYLSHCVSDEYSIKKVIQMFPNLIELDLVGSIRIAPLPKILRFNNTIHLSSDFLNSNIFNNIEQISITNLSVDGSVDKNGFYKKIIQITPDSECNKIWGQESGSGSGSGCDCNFCTYCNCTMCVYGSVGGHTVSMEEYRSSYGLYSQGPQGLYSYDKPDTRLITKEKVIYNKKSNQYRSHESNKKYKNPKIPIRWTKRR